MILINLTLDLAAVSVAHLWTYVDFLGPAVDTGPDTSRRSTPASPSASSGPGKRVASWVVVWNVCYWLLLCTPVIAIRTFLGAPNPLVP